MKPYISDYNINKILDSAVILIDTREKENQHIIDWLEKTKTPYEVKKLDYADYAMKIPKNETFGIMYDMLCEYVVERKASLEEISGNLTEDRTRIEEELWRGLGHIDIVIENGSVDDIYQAKYRTKYDHKAFIATLLSFQRRYGMRFHFVSKLNSPKYIYALLKYGAREELLK